jgi:hypothetical protein
MFGEVGVPLSDSYELYLEFYEDDLSCGYYIVDHSQRCVFWLEQVSTEDIEMSLSFSLEHLRQYFTLIAPSINCRPSHGLFLPRISGYGLEDMYWSHVEFYPSHRGIPTDGVVDNLLNTLAHAQGGACATLFRPGSPFFETHLRCPYH